jgi:quinol monooxygenase YgiN
MKTKILILLAVSIIAAFSCKPKTAVPVEVSETAIQPVEYKKMITARVFIKTGSEADFISAAKTMIDNSNSEEGCLGYMLYQDPYEKTNFIFVETYKNQAAVDAHFATSYFTEFGNKLADMTSSTTEIKIFDIAGEQ